MGATAQGVGLTCCIFFFNKTSRSFKFPQKIDATWRYLRKNESLLNIPVIQVSIVAFREGGFSFRRGSPECPIVVSRLDAAVRHQEKNRKKTRSGFLLTRLDFGLMVWEG